MMKKFLIAFFLLTCSSVVFAASFEPSTEAKLYYNQGVDYYKVQKYEQAVASFRQAIDLDPNYIDAYYNLGSLLEYLKQDEAALAIFKQVVVRKPDDYESVYKAAALSVKVGQADKAKAFLSLIPSESSVYSKAQQLASSLNLDMQTIKDDVENAEKEVPKFEQTNAMYNNIPSPTGIVVDDEANIYVACFSDNMIYKITPDEKRIIYIKDSRINGPVAMVRDIDGNMYVSNYNSDNVIKISPAGLISILISNIEKPYGMSIKDGFLFVSSQGSNSVLKYKVK